MATDRDENSLPLEEFTKLPTTVDFNIINTDRVKVYLKDKPYIKLGTELASRYVVAYTNEENLQGIFEDLGMDFLGFYPRILSPLDSKSNDDAGITKIVQQPYLNLTGRGVIIGFVDTGIDYTKSAFQYEDGTTKIISIWDQTREGERPDELYFGSVYTREQINEALQAPNPYEIVPMEDNDGHGTFLASVAASNEKNEYIGAASGAEIIVVKLRRAREYYINKFLLPKDEPNLYESTDYLLGMKYILDKSEEMNLPVVMCISMGSNMSGHDGNTYFEDYISFVGEWPGYAFVTAAGNESNAKHHTQGRIAKSGDIDNLSIKVGAQDTSFMVSIFAEAFDKISVGITSPTGESISRLPFKVGLEYSEKFIFEKTQVTIGYYKSDNTVIIIGFKDATEGIWEVTLYGESIISGDYYAWLPITGQVSPSVDFLKPVPEYTVCYPATGAQSIKCGAYNSNNNSLYASSSWGPTRVPRIAPDIVAPGVNVRGVYPYGYGTMSGTSVSAAITSGAVAILFEWAIINGNISSMDSDLARTLLISGASRDENIRYPNIKWGYGKLNLHDTFDFIKSTNILFEMQGTE